MTFCRAVPLGTLMNIFVPCTKLAGLARNVSSVASFQVTFALFMAGE